MTQSKWTNPCSPVNPHIFTLQYMNSFHPRYKEPPRLAGYITIIFIFFLSFLLNSSRFLEFKTVIRKGKCIFKPTKLRKNSVYVSIMMPIWTIVNNIIPMLLLTLLNIKLARVLSERLKVLRRLNIQQVVFLKCKCYVFITLDYF